tara:strand:- start:3084 stop:3260 length:177 start_codon:yes stop_codon:yes gene_type:complete
MGYKNKFKRIHKGNIIALFLNGVTGAVLHFSLITKGKKKNLTLLILEYLAQLNVLTSP